MGCARIFLGFVKYLFLECGLLVYFSMNLGSIQGKINDISNNYKDFWLNL